MVALRKANDRPSVTRLGRAFRELRRAIGKESDPALDLVLSRLGYACVKKGKHALRYEKGPLALRVKPFKVAEFAAYELRIKDRATKTKKTYVLIGGAMIPKRLWEIASAECQRVMDRFAQARKKSPGRPEPIDLSTIKDYDEILMTKEERDEEDERERALEHEADLLVAKLTALREEGRLPAGIVFYVEGPDGVGKTSTSEIIARALRRAGFLVRREIFKGPTEQEKKDPMGRFQRGVPLPGEAVIWDRGPAGDVIYGNTDARTRARELMGLERKLFRDNILMIKVELFASREKIAETFGKRLARQAIADLLRAEGIEAAGLLDVAHRIDAADFHSLVDGPRVQRRYLSFTGQTKKVRRWLVLNATHRHPARLRLVVRTGHEFDVFAARRERLSARDRAARAKCG
jgi:polyphosphate kinase 2 (PPK2 family)